MMMPNLSFTGGKGGDATNGDFSGTSGTSGASVGGSASGGSRGIIMNIGKGSGSGSLAGNASSNTLLYVAGGVMAIVAIVFLLKRK